MEKRKRKTKKRWLDRIKNNMRAIGGCVRNMENRDEWKFRTKVGNSK
jgi:hypothetical protein